ncbi:tRNA(Met) cytidine acetyltransferase TmcA [Nitrincola sp. MINF-07-Sa-05]|uniref:tRNA(Met) cytidine acetyltransferase TmcA n=1 Tax=Nitrincola salilacus TaxID=3400273 RepID=UPI003917D770
MDMRCVDRMGDHICRVGHRGIIWVAGNAEWCALEVQKILSHLSVSTDAVLVSDRSIAGLTPVAAQSIPERMGSTSEMVIFDAHAGFNPNSFGQIVGTLKGGGWFLLLTPALDDWPSFPDPEYAALCSANYSPEQISGHFIRFVLSELLSMPTEQLLRWWQNSDLSPQPDSVITEAGVPQQLAESPYLSQDQCRSVEGLLGLMKRRRFSAVLSSDRGRGKSSAIGLMLGLLKTEKPLRVCITAPSRASVDVIIAQMSRLTDTTTISSSHWISGGVEVIYLAPDRLQRELPTMDLLVVDEAAALPVSLLSLLLHHYPRQVFVTTLHGYEGNGRGFALRFLQALEDYAPDWVDLRMSQPLRWAANDPLEQLAYRVLLLDAEPQLIKEVAPDSADFHEWHASDLALHPDLLRSLFGLLIVAHYRTTPGDLRILLDSPNIRIFSLQHDDQVIATALVAMEGALPDDLCEQVWQGRRRPNGDLLPQTLIAQEGWREVGGWRAWRIIRIAVQPQLQRHHLGSILLQQVIKQAGIEQVDYCGASFAATPEVVGFWQRNGFQPVRLGDRRDSVTGTFPLVMLRPLTQVVEEWIPHARQQYRQSLLMRLPASLRLLEAPLAVQLLAAGVSSDYEAADEPLDATSHERLQGFVSHHRTVESNLMALQKLVRASIHQWHKARLSEQDQILLLNRILRQMTADEVQAATGLQGKRLQLQRLRELTGVLMGLI